MFIADDREAHYKTALNYRVEVEVMGHQPGEPCSMANAFCLGDDYSEDQNPDCYACAVCAWRQKGEGCLPGLCKPHMYRAHDYASSMACVLEMEQRLAAFDRPDGIRQDQPSSQYAVRLLAIVGGGAALCIDGVFISGSLLYDVLCATPLQRCEAALQTVEAYKRRISAAGHYRANRAGGGSVE